MNKPKITLILWILFYIFIFSYILNFSLSGLDPDFGWHIKVGQGIMEEKAVPNFEHYNFTLAGQKWVDHEWLINALTYIIYDNLGYLAVNIFFALLFVLIFAILHFFTKKYILAGKNGDFFIFIFLALGAFACLPHLGVRIQEITILNLLLLFIIIHFYNINKNWKILFFLPPLFYFWANTHAGFLIGIFVLFFWLFIKILELIINKYNILKLFPNKIKRFFAFLNFINIDESLNLKYIIIFFGLAVLSVLTTLFTPYGLKLYEFLGDYFKNTIYLKLIMEWQSFYYLPIQYLQLLYSAFFIIIILFSAIKFFNEGRTKPINLWDISAAAFFFLLAFKSKRNFPLFFVSSFPIIVYFFSDFFVIPDKFKIKNWPKQFIIIKIFLIIALLLLSFNRLLTANYIEDPFIFFKNSHPYKAAQYLKKHPELDTNLLSIYNWGGYLIWTLPEKKLFIDGRLSQYPYAGHTLMEEYYEFYNKDKIEDKINEYNIKLILLNSREDPYKLNWIDKYFLLFNQEKINKTENNLKNYLDGSSGWKVLYRDDVATVYSRL